MKYHNIRTKVIHLLRRVFMSSLIAELTWWPFFLVLPLFISLIKKLNRLFSLFSLLLFSFFLVLRGLLCCSMTSNGQ